VNKELPFFGGGEWEDPFGFRKYRSIRIGRFIIVYQVGGTR